MKICAVVPTFDNPQTVGSVVRGINAHDLPVIVVDDGSAAAGQTVCAELAAEQLAIVERHARNRGKGAACKTGFERARALGFTHAFQIDADSQHDLARIPAFVDAARAAPAALILGYPEYDESAPRSRRVARGLTDFWVAIEVGGRGKIRDAMIGFRIYPLAALANIGSVGDRMDFDIEIAVKLVRGGTPTVNLPVPVRYLRREEGGVSHFRPLRDNLRFAWMHSKICTLACMRWTWRKLWPGASKSST